MYSDILNMPNSSIPDRLTQSQLHELGYTILDLNNGELAINGISNRWLCERCGWWVKTRTSRTILDRKRMLCDKCCIEIEDKLNMEGEIECVKYS